MQATMLSYNETQWHNNEPCVYTLLISSCHYVNSWVCSICEWRITSHMQSASCNEILRWCFSFHSHDYLLLPSYRHKLNFRSYPSKSMDTHECHSTHSITRRESCRATKHKLGLSIILHFLLDFYSIILGGGLSNAKGPNTPFLKSRSTRWPAWFTSPWNKRSLNNSMYLTNIKMTLNNP